MSGAEDSSRARRARAAGRSAGAVGREAPMGARGGRACWDLLGKGAPGAGTGKGREASGLTAPSRVLCNPNIAPGQRGRAETRRDHASQS